MCCEEINNYHNLNQKIHQDSVGWLMLMGVQVPITKSKGKRDFSGATELLGSFGYTCCHHGSDIGWWPPPRLPPNLQGEFQAEKSIGLYNS